MSFPGQWQWWWLMMALCASWQPMTRAAIHSADADSKETSELWSLQTLKQPPIARLAQRVWPRNAIDHFVLAKLEQEGLGPSPEADRATLLRRLTFDLHGLPPAPAEIDAFIADAAPDAYERLVDRLLAAPQYGERWGRHWLDLARFTESQGFEYDHMREDAWPYRDYVIASFNQDKPFDRFIKEQLAGDMMRPETREGMVATGFLVCGAWDQAGSSQANVTQRLVTREEELEDMISVVAQTFLGLTVNCARCHSHKFDPIPQADYYRMKSVFEGVRHGRRPAPKPGEPHPQGETTPAAYVGLRQQPEPTHRLKRGDVRTPLEVVTPGGLSAVGQVPADLGLGADAPEGERRVRFAEWVVDRRNPLPARVLANRLWHFHFGQGIVSTPNDFGASGAKPSHPELLDWLASQLIEQNWSIKAVQRLILCSATYRQASTYRATAAQKDADNQWLWRFSPHRLEAEAVRDAILSVSGQLNLAQGGPSFRNFDTKSFNATFYFPKDKAGPEFDRRTVYRMNVNSGKDPLLEAFDCPDPSVKTPRRGVTTTPLQALSLMNSAFVQRQSRHFAERVQREAPGDTGGALKLAYRYCLGREPSPSELATAQAAAEEAGIDTVCWALLNATEFLYVK